jgi:hypothetical protein
VGDGWLNTYEFYTGPMGYGYPGNFVGEVKTGVIRSAPFTIEGNSINLLVGGGDYPNECYVALVDAESGEVLLRETGRNSNEMDRRYWSVRPYVGQSVYIEIADLSTGPFGHICVDDINESGSIVNGSGNNTSSRRKPHEPTIEGAALAPSVEVPMQTRLRPNVPNPFNPSTLITYDIAREGSVRLEVFDARGARVRRLHEGTRPAGVHRVTWDARDEGGNTVPSGVYFYRLIVDGRVVETRKMALLK